MEVTEVHWHDQLSVPVLYLYGSDAATPYMKRFYSAISHIGSCLVVKTFIAYQLAV